MDPLYTQILIGVGILLLLFIFLYNMLVRKQNQCRESWSGISVQLKRRYDLIPNLVSTVKGYAKHEREVFENVTKARTEAMKGQQSVEDQAKNENMLTGALKSLFAVAENYPNLKANENFLSLQEELTDTEDKLQAARRFYNSTVKSINTSIESIPSNIVAKIGGFKKWDFFELDKGEADAAKKTVEVKMDKQ